MSPGVLSALTSFLFLLPPYSLAPLTGDGSFDETEFTAACVKVYAPIVDAANVEEDPEAEDAKEDIIEAKEAADHAAATAKTKTGESRGTFSKSPGNMGAAEKPKQAKASIPTTGIGDPSPPAGEVPGAQHLSVSNPLHDVARTRTASSSSTSARHHSRSSRLKRLNSLRSVKKMTSGGRNIELADLRTFSPTGKSIASVGSPMGQLKGCHVDSPTGKSTGQRGRSLSQVPVSPGGGGVKKYRMRRTVTDAIVHDSETKTREQVSASFREALPTRRQSGGTRPGTPVVSFQRFLHAAENYHGITA